MTPPAADTPSTPNPSAHGSGSTAAATPDGTPPSSDSSVATQPLGARFVTFWMGQALSTIGSTVSGVGVAVYLFLTTGSAAWLGVLMAMATLPYVFAGPFFGVIDRVPRRRVLIVADCVSAAAWLMILVLLVDGALQPWHLAGAALLGGAANAFQGPAAEAVIPTLVASDALPRANGLAQFGPALGVVLGPMIATPLVATWGLEAVIIVDLVTFVVAMITVAIVRPTDPHLAVKRRSVSDERSLEGGGEPPNRADVNRLDVNRLDVNKADVNRVDVNRVDVNRVDVNGVDTASTQPDRGMRPALAFLRGPGRVLAVLLFVAAGLNVLLAGFNLALLALATEVAGPERAGLPLTVAGVAMLAGSIVAGSKLAPRQPVRTLCIGLVLIGVGCAIAGFRPSLLLLCLGAGVAVITIPAASAGIQTIFHRRVPAELQGRVFGLRTTIARAFEPLGSVGFGVLIASVMTPAMASDGALADVLAPVVGRGAGRGAAATLLFLGVGVALIGVGLWRSNVRRELDAAPSPSPTAQDRAPASVSAAAYEDAADGDVLVSHGAVQGSNGATATR